MKITSIALLLLVSISLRAEEWTPVKDPANDSTINGRAMETFQHGVKPEWGYAAPQQDTFIVVHPVTDRQKCAALCGAAFGRARCRLVRELHEDRRQP